MDKHLCHRHIILNNPTAIQRINNTHNIILPQECLMQSQYPIMVGCNALCNKDRCQLVQFIHKASIRNLTKCIKVLLIQSRLKKMKKEERKLQSLRRNVRKSSKLSSIGIRNSRCSRRSFNSNEKNTI